MEPPACQDSAMPLSRRDNAVLDALLPANADRRLGIGIVASGFEAFLGDFDGQAPPRLRRAFRIALVAGAWVAPLLIGRRPPIDRLLPEDRERALAAMDESPVPELRQLVSVLKTVVSLHYGGLDSVREAIGYP